MNREAKLSPESLKVFYTNCDCLSQTNHFEVESFIQSKSPDIIALAKVLPKKNSIFDMRKVVFALKGNL